MMCRLLRRLRFVLHFVGRRFIRRRTYNGRFCQRFISHGHWRSNYRCIYRRLICNSSGCPRYPSGRRRINGGGCIRRRNRCSRDSARRALFCRRCRIRHSRDDAAIFDCHRCIHVKWNKFAWTARHSGKDIQDIL